MKTRFYALKFGDKFVLAGKILQRESAFRAVTALGPRVVVAVWPWTRVRLVEDSDVASLREIDSRTRATYWRSTHFIGDGCFPPREVYKDDGHK